MYVPRRVYLSRGGPVCPEAGLMYVYGLEGGVLGPLEGYLAHEVRPF